ncbi:hypothetical protein [Ruania rhizosphaerae]|uniref:hypothetical protein n=1 Tax=Ruania rhizosphaerae TaxID=1840413 RepID=UPI001357F80D|nr:hypothetical protein [Ruania rhizosphaerae]
MQDITVMNHTGQVTQTSVDGTTRGHAVIRIHEDTRLDVDHRSGRVAIYAGGVEIVLSPSQARRLASHVEGALDPRPRHLSAVS